MRTAGGRTWLSGPVGLRDVAEPTACPARGRTGDPARRPDRAAGHAASKTSIATVFAGPRRPPRRPDLPPVRRSGDQLPAGQRDGQPLRRGAGGQGSSPRQRRWHHAAQLTGRRADDAGRGQVRRGRRACSTTTSATSVLAHSLGLLNAAVVVADADLINPIVDSGAEVADLLTIENLAKLAEGKPAGNPPSAAQVQARDTGVLHLHLRNHRASEGQRDDPSALAARAGGLQRPGCAVARRRHPVLRAAALPQQRADGRAVLGDRRRRHAGAGQVASRRRSSGTR